MKQYVFSESSVFGGSLILVNAAHPFHPVGEPNLVSVPDGENAVCLKRSAAFALSACIRKIGGWKKIAPVSGWRSQDEQQEIWDSSLAENGRRFTEQYVARPGCSEHQTGLAVDLGLRAGEIDFIRPAFPDSGIGRCFREEAAAFGFVERYPAGKEEITGIAHEEWHFRYVGLPHSVWMAEHCMTLEEYAVFLRSYPIGRKPLTVNVGRLHYSVGYLPVSRQGNAILETGDNIRLSVSGDNIGGLIVTGREEDSDA